MITARKLQTERLNSPVGIDFLMPRVMWLPEGVERQSAYRVIARDEKGGLFFDSGKVCSSETFCSRIFWSVTLWDEKDRKGEKSEEAYFETGILDPSRWRAKWINPELVCDPKKRKPASYLRKSFSLDAVGRARLYITCHGVYRVFLNGKEIEEYFLAPGTSQYAKRLMVQTLDVGRFLKCGTNEIVVVLADGWYRGSFSYDLNVNVSGTDVALLCQLENDGKAVCVSDETWQASQNGPLGLNDHMMGEEYDARRESITDWHSVKVETFGYGNLIGTDSVPVTAHEAFPAKEIRTPAGETVLDFGQNFSGYVEINIPNAKGGEKLTLWHFEELDAEGNFQNANFQNPKNPKTYQKLEYVCKPGYNHYHQGSCYFGFRYVKVETDLAVSEEMFTARAVYSDISQTGFLKCGNSDVEQLFSNALWSMKGNFVDVPTDCPTREKSGYSGDLQAYCHTAMYLMDCYPVLRRFVEEQAATQFSDGAVKQIAPDERKRSMYDGGAGWCDSFTIVPYRMALRYNDYSLIEEKYEQIKRWEQFCINRGKKTRFCHRKVPKELKPYFVDKGFLWGEWLEPDADIVQTWKDIFLRGIPEVATAYLSFGCRLVSCMAEKLGRKEDAAYFAYASEMAKRAYRYGYIRDGKVTEAKRQCCYVRPVALDLLSEGEKQTAVDTLARMVKENGNHLNTGFLTTNELCRVLTDYGHAETAYDLLLQEEAPGWLYAVKKGATTIWENWNGIGPDGVPKDSMNHYSYGAVVGWLFDRAAGIRLENGKLIIKPYPDRRLGYLDVFYDSPVGTIRVAWRYEDSQVRYHISVPCNVTAEVELGDGARSLATGEYEFVQVLEERQE